MKKSKSDYVAELTVTPETFSETFKEVLRNEYDITTEFADNSQNSFVSRSQVQSFFKEFVLAIPSHIDWSVEQLEPGKCHVSVNYQLSTYLKRYLYILCLIFGMLSSAMFYLISKHMKSNGQDILIQILGGVGSIGYRCLWLTILGVILCIMLGVLGIRFRLFGKSVVNSISQRLRHRGRVLVYESSPFRGDFYVHGLLPYLFPCVIFLPPMLMATEKMLEVIRKMGVFLVTVAILSVLLLLLDYFNRKDLYKSAKLSALACSLLLAICIQIIVIFLPYQLVKTSETAVQAKVNYILDRDQDATLTVSTLKQHDEMLRIRSLNERQTFLRQWKLLKLSYFLAWGVSFVLIYYCSRYFKYFAEGFKGLHNTHLKQEVLKKRKLVKSFDSTMLELSWATKIIVTIIFVIFLGACWYGVLLHLSVLNALIFPNHTIVLSAHGESISMGTSIVANAILWQPDSALKLYLFRWLLAIPAIFPFLLLIYLHLRHIKHVRIRLKEFIVLNNELSQRVKAIAKDMGIGKVECLLDKESGVVSPYAETRGFRKRIIMSQATISFLATYPQYLQVIIAHEVGHLKNDCRYREILNVMSRFSLLGGAFLSVLINTAKYEKKADEEAYAYLKHKNLDEKLLDGAIDDMKKHEHLVGISRRLETMPTTAFSVNSDNVEDDLEKNKESLPRIAYNRLINIPLLTRNRVLHNQCKKHFVYFITLFKLSSYAPKIKQVSKIAIDPLHIVYKIYFELKSFDYIHRQENLKLVQKEHKD